MGKVWVTQGGLRAEGLLLREHTTVRGRYLVQVPGGQHWFSVSEIEWNRS